MEGWILLVWNTQFDDFRSFTWPLSVRHRPNDNRASLSQLADQTRDTQDPLESALSSMSTCMACVEFFNDTGVSFV